MDQLAAIKVFVAIADAGSLSAAGRRLSMPLTTVSRHLAALEDEVGTRLIIRTTRDLALTETGRNYLESCRRILAELDAARLRVWANKTSRRASWPSPRRSPSAGCTSCRSLQRS